MKITLSHSTFQRPSSRAAAPEGWALLAVLTVVAAAVVILAGYMSWANQNATTVSRRNEYFATAYAAEAATEKSLAALVRDDENYGEGYVLSRLSNYATLVPNAADDSYWANYNFSAGASSNRVIVSLVSSNMSATLGAPYTGLMAQGFTYEIIANAQNSGSMYKILTTVGQRIVLNQIPMFQFAIFYENDLEIDPGANLTVNGLVHGNGNVFIYPNTGVNLTFFNDVSASAQLLEQPDPLDPTVRGAMGTVIFDGTHVSNVNPLDLPAGGGTNTLQNGASILQMPGPNGATNAGLLYNQVQMIILVSNASVSVTSGVANNQATVVPNTQWSQFLTTSTNNDFYDQRDGLPIDAIKLDVGNLRTWSATNTSLGPVDSIYIADLRSTSNTVIVTNTIYTTNVTYATNLTTTAAYPASGTYVPPVTTNGSGAGKTYTYGLISTTTTIVTNNVSLTTYPVTSQPGIVLTNGGTMPSSAGLGVATPDPVYIIGNWNVSTNGTAANLGTANTSQTYPSAIYSDAITVLSSAWKNANSAESIANRTAANDTVNAAFFTGNVPSNGSYYSGGVENFPRFLENWSGYTFTYNGSMVEAFYSQIANYPWPGTGSVYNPPVRNWAFDLNFNDPGKLPPLTPRVEYIQRTGWALLPPNTTSF